MELQEWQKHDNHISHKPAHEHYVPYQPNELEQATIDARKQGMTYGKWQQQQTIEWLRKEEEKRKKLEERKKKF